MKRSLLLLFFSCCAFQLAIAVNQTQSSFTPLGSVNVLELSKTDFAAKVSRIDGPNPSGDSYHAYLQSVKAKQQPNLNRSAVQSASADVPTVGKGFLTNTINIGVPTDNNIAISNDGMVISVANTSISIFDERQDSVLTQVSLVAFTENFDLIADEDQFDPHVLYDPNEDRFIMVWLSGRASDENEIVVAFSQTNDPLQDWNLYAVFGNLNTDATWLDYPLLGLTEDELFFTGNLIVDGQSWQEGFSETVIVQIDKMNGYAGQPLATTTYNDILWEGKPIRNLCPVRGGAGLNGPNQRFLSNRNFDAENDTIFIVEISDNQNNNPSVSVLTRRVNEPYRVPIDAEQSRLRTFQTNDARILQAIEADGEIHFVGNTYAPSTDKAAVYHGRITDIDSRTYVTTGEIITDDTFHFGYPAISYSGFFSGDLQAIINFNHASVDSFGGTSAIFWSNADGYSPRVTLSSGERDVNLQNGAAQRWGDYSGSQRRYNQPGTVWVNGFVARAEEVNQFDRGVGRTWVAELNSPGPSIVETNIKHTLVQPKSVKTYPIPSNNLVYVEFDLVETAVVKINILDVNGKVVKRLFEDQLKTGKQLLTFKTNPLSAGQYLVVGSSSEQPIFSERIIVE